MGLFDKLFGKSKNRSSPALSGPDDKKPRQCPNCNKEIKLDMERCPSCGVRIRSMFRRRCPHCNSLNEMDAKKCIKCSYDFVAEEEKSKKTYYTCPMCGYLSEGIMTECPACRTRFV